MKQKLNRQHQIFLSNVAESTLFSKEVQLVNDEQFVKQLKAPGFHDHEFSRVCDPQAWLWLRSATLASSFFEIFQSFIEF